MSTAVEMEMHQSELEHKKSSFAQELNKINEEFKKDLHKQNKMEIGKHDPGLIARPTTKKKYQNLVREVSEHTESFEMKMRQHSEHYMNTAEKIVERKNNNPFTGEPVQFGQNLQTRAVVADVAPQAPSFLRTESAEFWF